MTTPLFPTSILCGHLVYEWCRNVRTKPTKNCTPDGATCRRTFHVRWKMEVSPICDSKVLEDTDAVVHPPTSLHGASDQCPRASTHVHFLFMLTHARNSPTTPSIFLSFFHSLFLSRRCIQDALSPATSWRPAFPPVPRGSQVHRRVPEPGRGNGFVLAVLERPQARDVGLLQRWNGKGGFCWA